MGAKVRIEPLGHKFCNSFLRMNFALNEAMYKSSSRSGMTDGYSA